MSKRMQIVDRFRGGAARLAARAALLLAWAGPAQAGIVYDFELVASGSPTGSVIGSIELPSLSGASALPDAFSYTIFGNAFGLGQVFGASWEIDGTTGDFLNLLLVAQRQNVFPGSVPQINSTLSVGLTSSTNLFTDPSVQTIFGADVQMHRLVLIDDGGLLDLPAPPDPTPQPAPEPAALALFGLGLAGLAMRRRPLRPSRHLLL